jgi:excisionase family DNA binding protein
MEGLLTRDEVARLLRKPVSWLRYSERKRVIPYVKVGSQIRYRLADVEEWLRSREVNGRSQAKRMRLPRRGAARGRR